MSYDEAVKHIDKWYRYGDRMICVSRPVYNAYYDGLTQISWLTSKLPPPSDKFGRWFLAYKAARVYTN